MKQLRAAVEAGDIEAVDALLADDVEFRSPAVHKPYQGRDAAMVILRSVFRVFEDFRYVSQVEDGPDTVLRFRARVGDREIEGADFLHLNDEGLIEEFVVMVRPLSGLNALVAAMGEAIPLVMRDLGLAD